jgi:hypothetical protein
VRKELIRLLKHAMFAMKNVKHVPYFLKMIIINIAQHATMKINFYKKEIALNNALRDIIKMEKNVKNAMMIAKLVLSNLINVLVVRKNIIWIQILAKNV